MAVDRSDRSRAPVSAGYARAFLRHFARTEAERKSLLAGAGIDEAAINQPGAEMPTAGLAALVANVTRAHGELWALSATTVWSQPLQGGLDVATRTAPTLAAALAVGAHYCPVVAPFLRARVRTSEKALRFEVEPALDIGEADWRSIALAVALNTHASFIQVLEDDMAECAYEFPWPSPVDDARLKALFACRLTFGARAFAFVAPRRLAGRRAPFADPLLHEKAVAALEVLRERVFGGEDLADAIRRHVESALPRRLTETQAARRLGWSRRTLQRRLADAGQSFRPLLDETLRARARSMLEKGELSRDEIAAALGYSDSTSFSRACRRWFGPHAGR
ncbi:MAG: helix-turn-helix transcriptional regulator, partial [Hyphomicrobiales bacterium]|nr:helix-turn-helix transcriptional regulator [Hyphomicrobiales bacterium]